MRLSARLSPLLATLGAQPGDPRPAQVSVTACRTARDIVWGHESHPGVGQALSAVFGAGLHQGGRDAAGM